MNQQFDHKTTKTSPIFSPQKYLMEQNKKKIKKMMMLRVVLWLSEYSYQRKNTIALDYIDWKSVLSSWRKLSGIFIKISITTMQESASFLPTNCCIYPRNNSVQLFEFHCQPNNLTGLLLIIWNTQRNRPSFFYNSGLIPDMCS